MKIGIITFQKSKNYGGVLQAYALYTRLKQLGYSVEMVDYWPTYRDSMQFKFPKIEMMNQALDFICVTP